MDQIAILIPPVVGMTATAFTVMFFENHAATLRS
jgi:hypothetical protein